MTSRAHEKRMTVLAVVFAAAGVAVLAALLFVQAFPQPWWLWVVFVVAFVALDHASVEVSGRFLISSSMMVAFTSAVAFGRNSAVLAVSMMAVAAMLDPKDLKRHRRRQAASNFGQLVVSASVGIAFFSLFLPAEAVTVDDLPLLAIGAAAAATVFGWVNYQLVALFVRIAYPDRSRLPWSAMLPTHVSLTALGAYGGILGAAYVLVGPVILPLLFVAFLVGHVGFASHAGLRRAHEDTIRGIVKAVEALDPFTRGHTERVAHFVQVTGEHLGLSPDRLDRLRWAALIHDVGKVAVPPGLLFKPGPLDAEEYRTMVRHMRVVEEVLGRVEFLAPMVDIAAAHHSVVEGSGADLPIEPRILAVADTFDAMTSTRSYRAAVTQADAFAELRERVDVFGADVVEGLIAAIEERGEVYGSPDEESAAAVERLVRERAVRA